MSTPSIVVQSLKPLLWAVSAIGALGVVLSSLPYFLAEQVHPFITERPYLTVNSLWRTLLNLHIGGGMYCLPVGLFLMSKRALSRWPKLHKVSGRIYVAVVIVCLFPTGIYLSYYAKGGMAAGTGFFLSNVLSTVATVLAIIAVAKQDIQAHHRHMLRGYAQIASAITFRIYHLAFQLLQLPYESNYIASLWLSVLGNALIAEFIISYFIAPRRGNQPLTTQRGKPNEILHTIRGIEPRTDVPQLAGICRAASPGAN